MHRTQPPLLFTSTSTPARETELIIEDFDAPELDNKPILCSTDVSEVEKRVKFSEDRQLLHVIRTGQLTVSLNYTSKTYTTMRQHVTCNDEPMISDVPKIDRGLYVKAELKRTDPKWKDHAVTASCNKHNCSGTMDPIMPTQEARGNYIMQGTSRRRTLYLECEKPVKNSQGEMAISPVLQVMFPCFDSCGESS